MRAVVAGVVVVSVAMAVVMGVFIARAVHAPQPLPKASRMISFEDQWAAAGMTVAMATPRRVAIERIVEPAVLIEGATSAPKTEVASPRAVPHRIRHAERDICRGKGRTYTKNGKSWRCKR